MVKTRVMQPKKSRPALTAEDIEVGKTYRGKNPVKAGGGWRLNDRTVILLSLFREWVQYDSSAVKDGADYPTVSMEAFLEWASHEVF